MGPRSASRRRCGAGLPVIRPRPAASVPIPVSLCSVWASAGLSPCSQCLGTEELLEATPLEQTPGRPGNNPPPSSGSFPVCVPWLTASPAHIGVFLRVDKRPGAPFKPPVPSASYPSSHHRCCCFSLYYFCLMVTADRMNTSEQDTRRRVRCAALFCVL